MIISFINEIKNWLAEIEEWINAWPKESNTDSLNKKRENSGYDLKKNNEKQIMVKIKWFTEKKNSFTEIKEWLKAVTKRFSG